MEVLYLVAAFLGEMLVFSIKICLWQVNTKEKICYVCTLNVFFHQIKSFLRFRLAFVFGLQSYYLIDFSKIYQLKGLEPKNKG